MEGVLTMSNHPRTDRKVQREQEGAERNAKWQALTTVEKVKELDRRLGPNVGATRQRKVLAQA